MSTAQELEQALAGVVGMKKRPTTTTSAYLAARFDRREELRRHMHWLEKHGVNVTSRWLRHDHDATDVNENQRLQFLYENVIDVLAADTLILFTASLDTDMVPAVWARGGMNVEWGMALVAMKRLIIIGPRTNIFTHIPDVWRFEDILGLKRQIRAEEVARA